jgi:hypothetical protein
MRGSFAAIVLSAFVASALAADAAFKEKPTARQAGEKIEISFSVAGPTDVEVAIVSADGRVVRNLAAGVLGGSNASPPPLVAGLSQKLRWDGKDDFGKRVADAENCKVRVRAGLGVKFRRFIGGDDPHTFGLVDSMVSDPAGNMYVMGYREEDSLTAMTLRKFSPTGRYERTVLPFPADLPPEAMKDVASWDEQAGVWRPVNYRATNVQFYTLMGSNGSGGRPAVTFDLVSARDEGILLTDGSSLYRLDSRGGMPGEKFKVRQIWASGARLICGRMHTAVSPDGKTPGHLLQPRRQRSRPRHHSLARPGRRPPQDRRDLCARQALHAGDAAAGRHAHAIRLPQGRWRADHAT